MHFDDSICSMRGRNFRKEWTRDNFNGEAQLQSRHLLYTEQWTVMYFHNISYGENLLTFSLGGIQQLGGPNFNQFWTLPPSSELKWTFYILSILCHMTHRGLFNDTPLFLST